MYPDDGNIANALTACVWPESVLVTVPDEDHIFILVSNEPLINEPVSETVKELIP